MVASAPVWHICRAARLLIGGTPRGLRPVKVDRRYAHKREHRQS